MELIGIVVLISLSVLLIGKGADWFTDSLIPVARNLGVSGISVGLLLVSTAVSLPEVLVAIDGSLHGYPGLALGVIFGSVIANIGLMTGLAACVAPLKVTRHLILRDGIFSLIIPILIFAIGHGGTVSRFEGLAILLLFIPYVINVFLQERVTQGKAPDKLKVIVFELKLLGFDMGKLHSGWLSFVFGLGALILGTQIFSSQLINIVSHFGQNDLFIGLTLGAIGPSIPNILTAIKAAQRGMGEIALSETLGSNIFTLLVTLGIVAMISPLVIQNRWLVFDIPAVVFMSFLLFFFMITKKSISTFEGAILILAYSSILLIQSVLK